MIEVHDTARDLVEGDYEPAPTCPLCGGPQFRIAILGATDITRCRHCGMTYTTNRPEGRSTNDR